MVDNFIAHGGRRCGKNPVRFEYTERPAEIHYCLCTDCIDVCGGTIAIRSVIRF